jgi:hypothetical protein
MGTSKTRGEQGSTISLKAAMQPGHWLRAQIYNNNHHRTAEERRESWHLAKVLCFCLSGLVELRFVS